MKIIIAKSSYSANPYPYRLYNILTAYTLTQAHPDTHSTRHPLTQTRSPRLLFTQATATQTPDPLRIMFYF